MSRYIDVEGFEKLFDEEYKSTRRLINEGETHLDNIAEGFSEAAKVIRSIPTADVVEVRQINDFIQRLRNIPGLISHLDLSRVCSEFGFDYYGAKMERKERK